MIPIKDKYNLCRLFNAKSIFIQIISSTFVIAFTHLNLFLDKTLNH